MPSINIHLAIGNRYIEKNKVENKKEFLKGIVAPDFAKDKIKSHYSTNKASDDNMPERVKDKVNIIAFLNENKVETDYEKGVFLHLYTDKMFFEKFFSTEFLKNTNFKDFFEDLYCSYQETNTYLEEKYNIQFTQEDRKQIAENIKNSRTNNHMSQEVIGKNIINIKKLEEFIEKMSNVNITECINELKAN